MRAVWTAARAAVRRRRLQTAVIGIVILLSTTTLIFGLGLLRTANAPFDDAFAAARGAHVTAAYDPARVTDGALSATAHATGVSAAAGPFPTAVLPRMDATDQMGGIGEGTLVAGRADPGGPVDRLSIVAGRWATAPGELVVEGGAGIRDLVGKTLVPSTGGLPNLRVVGIASSATKTAGGWVTPAQIAPLGGGGRQMLYRFVDTGSVTRDLGAVTRGLPAGALAGSETYLDAKHTFQKNINQILPFITIFGVLGAIVSVMVIANVVSGAVVSGFRHIGVMKSLGFTPAQVTGVYVTMVTVPGLAGCLIGAALGNLLATALVTSVRQDFDLPSAGAAVDLPLDLLAVAAVVAVMAGTALIPALRAGRLPAARAISPAARSGRGRGRAAQRRLARAPLPSAVGLGLGLPFARPGRTLLTLAAVGLGALAATLGLGLHESVGRIVGSTHAGGQVIAWMPPPGAPGSVRNPPAAATLESLLRGVPGTGAITTQDNRAVHVAGMTSEADLEVYDGDSRSMFGKKLAAGRWFSAPGEVLASEGFMRSRHHRLGDTVRFQYGGRTRAVRIVGTIFQPADNRFMADRSTVSELIPGLEAPAYEIGLRPGTDLRTYLVSAQKATRGTGLDITTQGGGSNAAVFNSLFLLCTLILCVSAGLGVLNTAVLNTRERARDLGVLKSIGMAPAQVVVMVLTSMGAIGVLGGLAGVPLGILTHHEVLAYTGWLIQAGMPSRFVTVYSPAMAVLLLLSGPAIGLLGAWPPATWAARRRTAPVLRSE